MYKAGYGTSLWICGCAFYIIFPFNALVLGGSYRGTRRRGHPSLAQALLPLQLAVFHPLPPAAVAAVRRDGLRP